jgi:alpha-tubulin suppressor-like RCC1 family protein
MPTVTSTGESTQFTGSERPGVYRLRATVTDRATGTFITEVDWFVDVLVVYVCVHTGTPPTNSQGNVECTSDSGSTTPPVMLVAKEEQQFSATVTTYDGTNSVTYTASNPAILSWSWSVQETTGGSIGPATGLYTAPARGGTYHVKATVEKYSRLRSTSAAVVVSGVTVHMEPPTYEVRAGATIVLTATATGVIRGAGSVTWSIQEGSAGGTLDTDLATFEPAPETDPPVDPPLPPTSTIPYTAPAAGGGKTFRVIATSTADTSVRAIATIRVLGVWTSVATGGHHTVAVKSDGTLWAWGNNYYGQLGDGTTIDRSEPVQVGDDTDWVSVSAGANHTLALKGVNSAGRSLYAWGSNSHGQLGDNTFTDRNAPVQIQINTVNEWVSVSARGNHTVAIKFGGTLWAWGENTYGQVGNGGGAVQPVPAQIIVGGQNGTPLTWATVAAGTDHTLAIATDESLWAWGRNDAGQLGVSDTDDRLVPARVGSASDWLDVDGGGAHSVGIRRVGDSSTAGSLWAWGDNSEAQLGNDSGTPSWVPIQVGTETTWKRVIAGEFHVFAVNAEQALWGWGRNARGELGIAQNVAGKEEAPVRVGNVSLQWAAADSGSAHTVMVTADGRLFVSGLNLYGEIGNGQIAKKLQPSRVSALVSSWAGANLAAGWNHSAAVAPDGRLWTWGSNAYGQLGDGTFVDRDVPVEIPAGTGLTWLKVSAGAGHTVAIRSDGRIFTWGDNSLGQLGRALGATGEQCPPLLDPCTAATPGEIPQFLGFDPWVDVAAGALHTVAITRNGELWAWGNNDFGQIGIAPTQPCSEATPCREPFPVRVQDTANGEAWLDVDAGRGHTLGIKREVVRDAGGFIVARPVTLWAWGLNENGQVGDGTTIDRTSPTKIGTAPDPNDPTRVVYLSGWTSVQAGGEQSFAIMGPLNTQTGSGELWRWGSNVWGQLDIGLAPGPTAPVRVDSVSWKSVWGGGLHSVGIMADGTLWTWGQNGFGQLGNGSLGDRFIKVQIGVGSQWATAAAGLFHTLAVRSDGTLWTWGNNNDGQLGDGTAWIQLGDGTPWVNAPFEIK